ncbi:MAG: carbohydrate-binding domain-containing protein, partial [Verrucomicrobiales bacterium]
DVPVAGKYALKARVATPSWKQSLRLVVNGAGQPSEIALPHTVGMWDTTEPLGIELVKGRNVLQFSREGDVKGITIKDFTLSPVSGDVSQLSDRP